MLCKWRQAEQYLILFIRHYSMFFKSTYIILIKSYIKLSFKSLLNIFESNNTSPYSKHRTAYATEPWCTSEFEYKSKCFLVYMRVKCASPLQTQSDLDPFYIHLHKPQQLPPLCSFTIAWHDHGQEWLFYAYRAAIVSICVVSMLSGLLRCLDLHYLCLVQSFANCDLYQFNYKVVYLRCLKYMLYIIKGQFACFPTNLK